MVNDVKAIYKLAEVYKRNHEGWVKPDQNVFKYENYQEYLANQNPSGIYFCPVHNCSTHQKQGCTDGFCKDTPNNPYDLAGGGYYATIVLKEEGIRFKENMPFHIAVRDDIPFKFAMDSWIENWSGGIKREKPV